MPPPQFVDRYRRELSRLPYLVWTIERERIRGAILVAGHYGAATANKRMLFIQVGTPARA